jgi:hypothetical protein
VVRGERCLAPQALVQRVCLLLVARALLKLALLQKKRLTKVLSESRSG